jgi:hypothetical protein
MGPRVVTASVRGAGGSPDRPPPSPVPRDLRRAPTCTVWIVLPGRAGRRWNSCVHLSPVPRWSVDCCGGGDSSMAWTRTASGGSWLRDSGWVGGVPQRRIVYSGAIALRSLLSSVGALAHTDFRSVRFRGLRDPDFLRAGELCDIVNFIAVPPIGFSQDVLPTGTTSRPVPATGVHPEGLPTAVETKKITATRDDPQGTPVKKRPDACLLSA